MMNAIETKESVIPVEVMVDVQRIADCLVAGTPVPPDLARRVHEHSERIRQRVLDEHGILDIAVPAIREFRGELPLP